MLHDRGNISAELLATVIAEQRVNVIRLGELLLELGLYEEAEPRLRFAAAQREDVAPAEQPDCANLAFAHGLCLARLGFYTDAEPLLAYIASMQSFVTGEATDMLPVISERIATIMKNAGEFRLTTAAGCFVCH